MADTQQQKENGGELTIKEKVATLKSNGLKIELVGRWLWVTGKKTFYFRELLKEYGFNYSKNKKSWYYSEAPKLKSYISKYRNFSELEARFKVVEL